MNRPTPTSRAKACFTSACPYGFVSAYGIPYVHPVFLWAVLWSYQRLSWASHPTGPKLIWSGKWLACLGDTPNPQALRCPYTVLNNHHIYIYILYMYSGLSPCDWTKIYQCGHSFLDLDHPFCIFASPPFQVMQVMDNSARVEGVPSSEPNRLDVPPDVLLQTSMATGVPLETSISFGCPLVSVIEI